MPPLQDDVAAAERRVCRQNEGRRRPEMLLRMLPVPLAAVVVVVAVFFVVLFVGASNASFTHTHRGCTMLLNTCSFKPKEHA